MASLAARRVASSLLLVPALLCLLAGCRLAVFRSEVVVRGAWDVLPIADRSRAQAALLVGRPVAVSASTTSVADLKRGEADVAILGREPTPDELDGLDDTVVAYDAVCILIDRNSYKGGDVGEPTPVANSAGVRQMTRDDLRRVFGFWRPRSEDHYVWRGGIIRLKDAGKDKNTGEPLKQWLEEPTKIAGLALVVGKYDTQAVLYQALGLSEAEMAAAVKTFAASWLSTEEEVIAWEYPNTSPYTAGSLEFRNKVGFASLRVARMALARTAVSILAVDGVDPVAEPRRVYDGSYAFSRKIHVLTREDRSEEVDRLVAYFLSSEGQERIAEMGFLPLQPAAPARGDRR